MSGKSTPKVKMIVEVEAPLSSMKLRPLTEMIDRELMDIIDSPIMLESTKRAAEGVLAKRIGSLPLRAA